MQTQSIVVSSSPSHTLTVMLTQAGANPAAKQQISQKLFPARKSVRITGHRALGQCWEKQHFGNPAWVGQVCSCHSSESAGEPRAVVGGQMCNRLLHPHFLPILALQEAREDRVKFPSDSEQRTQTPFTQKMLNPTAKNRTPEVQKLSSEHLICNSDMWDVWPQCAAEGLHFSIQKRLAQNQKLCSVHTGEEPYTHHLTQGARKSKDIIDIFKQLKQGDILYSFYYDHKSMLQELSMAMPEGGKSGSTILLHNMKYCRKLMYSEYNPSCDFPTADIQAAQCAQFWVCKPAATMVKSSFKCVYSRLPS